jgi:hypothetical protein
MLLIGHREASNKQKMEDNASKTLNATREQRLTTWLPIEPTNQPTNQLTLQLCAAESFLRS